MKGTCTLFFEMKPNHCCLVLFYITLIVSLTLVWFPAKVGGLGSSSTIGISYGSGTVCGILAGNSSQNIQCFQQNQTVSVLSDISYEAISGGKDFICGLTSGGSSLSCWDTTLSNTRWLEKRIYDDPESPLYDLTVGDDQVCGLVVRTGALRCWKKGLSSTLIPFSPSVKNIEFHKITSGVGFLCGIVKNQSNVLCWGENWIAHSIEVQFSNMSMLSLVAGKSHVCGITISGILVCKGNNESSRIDVPSKTAFYYADVAPGGNYTCALHRDNGTVVCWGDQGQITDARKIQNFSFESIISGLDFTCGLTNDTLILTCWGSGWSSKFVSFPSLQTMIPGSCVRDPCRICSEFSDSESLCGRDTNICRSCVVKSPLFTQLGVGLQKKTSTVAQPVQAPMGLLSSSPSSKAKRRPFWVYEIFGSVGILSGLCALGYFLYLKSCISSSDGKVQIKEHDSDGSNNVYTAFVTSNPSSAPQSRSSSITQISSLTSLRQRSCDLSMKHVEKAEIFSLYELAAATKNFSHENKIGRGSFGTVYTGKLIDSREVAIKREERCTRKERGNAFESELALLSRVHHKHLVSLIGFCEENNERLLVYEYMSNGALHDHLHSVNNIQKGSSPLNSWDMRIKIALDAARGIEYLHSYAVPPIIHRDIKTSNILLDSKWGARVSDFGLSLKWPDSGESSKSIKAVGTVGYIDPEYYVLQVLTTKSDVYGFGVVLLELLTGKRAVFKQSEENGPTGVVEYAGPFIMSGEVSKVLDKRLEQPIMNHCEAIELLAYTAMMCVNLEGKDRPTMSEIVSNLERALSLCKGSCALSPTYSFN